MSSTLSRRLGRGSLTSHGLWRRPGPDFTDGSSSVSLNLGGWRGWWFIRQCEGWSHTDRGAQALLPRPRSRPSPLDSCLLQVLAEAPCRLPSPQAAPPRSFTPGPLSLPPGH